MGLLDETLFTVLRQHVDAEEAWLKQIFGPGGELEGLQDEYIIEEDPPVTTLKHCDQDNCVILSTTSNARVRHKTKEELLESALRRARDR